MSKILYLPLRAKWYEMIESGEKVEEYREIKPYWVRRLLEFKRFAYDEPSNLPYFAEKVVEFGKIPTDMKPVDYTHVRFSYGYTKRTMTFEIRSINIGRGKVEWGAPKDKNVFIIKLGKKL